MIHCSAVCHNNATRLPSPAASSPCFTGIRLIRFTAWEFWTASRELPSCRAIGDGRSLMRGSFLEEFSSRVQEPIKVSTVCFLQPAEVPRIVATFHHHEAADASAALILHPDPQLLWSSPAENIESVWRADGSDPVPVKTTPLFES